MAGDAYDLADDAYSLANTALLGAENSMNRANEAYTHSENTYAYADIAHGKANEALLKVKGLELQKYDFINLNFSYDFFQNYGTRGYGKMETNIIDLKDIGGYNMESLSFNSILKSGFSERCNLNRLSKGSCDGKHYPVGLNIHLYILNSKKEVIHDLGEVTNQYRPVTTETSCRRVTHSGDGDDYDLCTTSTNRLNLTVPFSFSKKLTIPLNSFLKIEIKPRTSSHNYYTDIDITKATIYRNKTKDI